MRDDIEIRTLNEAKFIIENKATVRATAKVFHVGKSTVHKDMTKRLKALDYDSFLIVKKILLKNLNERHIRGGLATKRKYSKK